MPFGYSRAIFPHPPVQYIPLSPLDSLRIDTKTAGEDFKIFIGTEVSQIKGMSDAFSVYLPSRWYDLERGQFFLMVVNGDLFNLYYRGTQVRGVGKKIKNRLTFWLMNTVYFYREKVNFLIFDEEAEKIGEIGLDLADIAIEK